MLDSAGGWVTTQEYPGPGCTCKVPGKLRQQEKVRNGTDGAEAERQVDRGSKTSQQVLSYIFILDRSNGARIQGQKPKTNEVK